MAPPIAIETPIKTHIFLVEKIDVDFTGTVIVVLASSVAIV
jgi:hypothetical protein